jgi:hypothetical protein
MPGAWLPQDRGETCFIPALMGRCCGIRPCTLTACSLGPRRVIHLKDLMPCSGQELLICGFRRVCTDAGLESAGAMFANGDGPGVRLCKRRKTADWA